MIGQNLISVIRVAKERYQAKSYGPRCFMGYFYSLSFAKSQIIPSMNQLEISPCLLIDEPQNLNLAK